MRAVIVILVLVAVGIGITGIVLGWFTFSTAPNEDKRDITLTVDSKKIKKDQDAFVGLFRQNRADFQKQAETRLTAMDRNLDDLKVKAKIAGSETKDAMDKEIGDLNQRTEAAREEVKELRTASQERYESMRTRVDASLNELKDGFDKAASRFQ